MPAEAPGEPGRSVNLLLFDREGRVFLQFRDGSTGTEPLRWGFWGGRIDAADADPHAAAVRECREELGLSLARDQFALLHQREGGDGQQSFLLRCLPPIGWNSVTVNEGAGAGFFHPAELAALTLHKRARYYLETRPEVFGSA